MMLGILFFNIYKESSFFEISNFFLLELKIYYVKFFRISFL